MPASTATASRQHALLARLPVCTAWVALCLAAIAAATGAAAQRLTALDPLDARGTVTYYIAAGTPDSDYRPGDAELAQWALRDWQRALKGALTFKPAAEREALIRIYFVAAEAGQYGETRPIVVAQTHGAEVYVRPNTDALGPDVGGHARVDALFRDTIVYLTCLHEIGHALGLGHTDDFADVMYFFGYGGDIPAFFERYRDRLHARSDIAAASGLGAGDLDQLHEHYVNRQPAAQR